MTFHDHHTEPAKVVDLDLYQTKESAAIHVKNAVNAAQRLGSLMTITSYVLSIGLSVPCVERN